uniref:Aspartate aminotransferase n=1 Tax=Peronospora matthiolae TaxID=2874970 RepID=A0AAV1TKB3_9STRA
MGAKLKIAYAGCRSERVARHFEDNSASGVVYKSAKDACIALKNEEVDLAVVPIETSALGSIHTNYDLLLKYDLHVVGEYDLPKVGFTSVQAVDIAPYTRFLLLSKTEDLAWNAKTDIGDYKTSMVFGFKNNSAKGLLNRALEAFTQFDLELIKIDSRPWNGQPLQQYGGEAVVDSCKYKYLFYVDFQGHLTGANMAAAIWRMREVCSFVRILGSYVMSRGEKAIKVENLSLESSRFETDTISTMDSKYPLNPVFQKVTVAKTMLIHGQTKQMEAEGKKVWSLCVGEPDCNPHDHVLAAGAKAMIEGNVKYSHMKGIAELRGLISMYLEKAKGLKYDPATQVLVSNGAQQSVFQALYTVCQPGQKVIIPTPYWLNYPEIVKLVYAEPIPLRTLLEDNYLINPATLEKTLMAHPDAKVIILCNPSNPSGTLHSPQHLERIAAVLRKPQFRHIVVVSDEIYEQLLYQDEGVPERKHMSFAALPGMYERTLLVNGFSKAHAMTGLRVGYLAAPKHFIDPCTLLQAQLTSCPNTVGQVAAVEALTMELECMEKGERRIAPVMKNLNLKRHYIVKRLTAMPNVRFAYPTSAFYVFVDLSSYFEGKKVVTANKRVSLASVDDFCAHLLHHSHIAVVPGSEFGDEFGMRISYASSMEAIRHAMDGMENLLKSLTFVSIENPLMP